MHDTGTTETVLVVDLDGTLLRSDMLFECFWAATANDWRAPIHAFAAYKDGKPALKRVLAEAGRPDIARLPYDPNVIEYVERHKAAGGRTALVTATDQDLAQSVAHHLGIFDDVYGTTADRNLKGEVKAAFLVETFGEDGFVYIGDSTADLPVWEKAKGAVTVGASASLRNAAGAANPNVTHLSSPEPLFRPVLKAMRLHQWLKNALIFVPLVASLNFSWLGFLQCILAFLIFGLVASSGYVLNDLLDLGPDRAHLRKRNRPMASGRLPVPKGTALFPILLGAGLFLSLFLGLAFTGAILFYFIMTMSYSLWLKRKVMVDICVLAGLYTLRIVAGALATGIVPSIWLLALSMFFFFSLAAVKRQAELVDMKDSGKSSIAGRGYRLDDLGIVTQIALSSGLVSVLVMAMYLNEASVTLRYSTPVLLWGVNVVMLYWITRMVFVTHRGRMHDDPLIFAVTDRTSQVCLSLMILLFAGAVAL